MLNPAAKDTIAIVGPYPLPYGGISMHIQRTVTWLRRTGINFVVFDESSNSLLSEDRIPFSSFVSRSFGILRLLVCRYKLIHYHSPNRWGRLFFCLLGLFGKEVYLHVHGASLHEAFKDKIFAMLFGKLLKRVHLIADNEEIFTLGAQYDPKSIRLIDAFVPPDTHNLSKFLTLEETIPTDKDLVISMVGWFEEFNGEDLYGFDILCETARLLTGNITFRCIVSVNGIKSHRVRDDFYDLLDRYKLHSNFEIITDDLEEAWPLFFYSDVFIRPSRTDGSAVSIREALWVGTPVIASDCAPRVEGVELFTCGSASSLADKLLRLASGIKERGRKPRNISSLQSRHFKFALVEEVYQQ